MMRGKRTQATQSKQKPTKPKQEPETQKPPRPEADSPHQSAFPLYEGETCENDKS